MIVHIQSKRRPIQICCMFINPPYQQIHKVSKCFKRHGDLIHLSVARTLVDSWNHIELVMADSPRHHFRGQARRNVVTTTTRNLRRHDELGGATVLKTFFTS